MLEHSFPPYRRDRMVQGMEAAASSLTASPTIDHLLHLTRVPPSRWREHGLLSSGHIVWTRTAGGGSLVWVIPSADGYEVSHVLGSLCGAVELSIHSALRTLLQRATSAARTTYSHMQPSSGSRHACQPCTMESGI